MVVIMAARKTKPPNTPNAMMAPKKKRKIIMKILENDEIGKSYACMCSGCLLHAVLHY